MKLDKYFGNEYDVWKRPKTELLGYTRRYTNGVPHGTIPSFKPDLMESTQTVESQTVSVKAPTVCLKHGEQWNARFSPLFSIM